MCHQLYMISLYPRRMGPIHTRMVPMGERESIKAGPIFSCLLLPYPSITTKWFQVLWFQRNHSKNDASFSLETILRDLAITPNCSFFPQGRHDKPHATRLTNATFSDTLLPEMSPFEVTRPRTSVDHKGKSFIQVLCLANKS